jgi:hypothetical protein
VGDRPSFGRDEGLVPLLPCNPGVDMHRGLVRLQQRFGAPSRVVDYR